MYKTIKHWDKTAYAGGEPDWTMEVIEVVVIQAWGGNYGNSSYGIYMERETEHYYYITDHQFGNYSKKRLEHLDDKHIGEVAKEAHQALMQNYIKVQ